jgi:hypothetical protein
VGRLFSMFPSGRPGIGLMVLRFCLVSMLLLHASRFGPILSLPWMTPVLLLIAAALCIGVATPHACLLSCAAEIVFALTTTGFDATVLIATIPVAAAIILLGPGAYSLDAHIFGRRVIVLPTDNNR